MPKPYFILRKSACYRIPDTTPLSMCHAFGLSFLLTSMFSMSFGMLEVKTGCCLRLNHVDRHMRNGL